MQGPPIYNHRNHQKTLSVLGPTDSTGIHHLINKLQIIRGPETTIGLAMYTTDPGWGYEVRNGYIILFGNRLINTGPCNRYSKHSLEVAKLLNHTCINRNFFSTSNDIRIFMSCYPSTKKNYPDTF